jgi:hypothetical protein
MNCPNCEIPLINIGNLQHCKTCGFNFFENQKEINEIYCWLSVDSQGREGMIAFDINGTHMVALHSDKAFALKLKPKVENAALHTGMKMRLAKFIKTGIEEEIG